jgi:hypothetical protein
MRAAPSGNTLSYRDTQVVKGMLLQGDRQHDIAAFFGINAGRIAEVSTGDCAYPNAPPTPEPDLPPPGPYLSKFALQSVIDTVNEAIEAIELAEQEEEVADVKAALVLAKETLVNKIKSLLMRIGATGPADRTEPPGSP